MANTIRDAIKTVHDIDDIISRLSWYKECDKESSPINEWDVPKLLNILDQVRELIMNSPAYISVSIYERGEET